VAIQAMNQNLFSKYLDPDGPIPSPVGGLIIDKLLIHEQRARLRQQRGNTLFPTLPTRLGKKPVAVVTEIRWSTLTVKTVALYPFDNIHVSDEQ